MKILFVSLGCDKNLADTEYMLGKLGHHGYEFTDDEYEAEIIVVNTCCFIHDAKEESIQTLIELGRLKEEGKAKALLATGCLAQRYKDEIKQELPEVDAIIGINSIDKIVEAVEEVIGKKGGEHFEDINAAPIYGKERIVTTGGHYAYLKIAEGCNKNCTYCIIPKIRGNYRSIPMNHLVEAAKDLAEKGVKELILVAQETTLYGVDLYGENKLPELLKSLCEIAGLYWIRILYCYPEEITEELIAVMKQEPKICKYLDIPIQHASDQILQKMGRRARQDGLRAMIKKLRDEMPDICIRTTFITGFPGETKEDHEEVMRFIDEMEFDRLGVFTYSPEEETIAAEMPDQVLEETKKDRQAEIMELQQEIAFEKAEEMIGRKVLVMIEGKVADENAYVGRTYRDAPNVDGLIFVNSDLELMTGDYIHVIVTGSYEYDLIGEIEE